VRLYDRLFNASTPGAAGEDGQKRDFLEDINPSSLELINEAIVEPALLELPAGEVVQFERLGYFCADTLDSREGAPVFNRTITLKDSWAKIAKKG
jgi:glutaminyl-tRNA synthetase